MLESWSRPCPSDRWRWWERNCQSKTVAKQTSHESVDEWGKKVEREGADDYEKALSLICCLVLFAPSLLLSLTRSLLSLFSLFSYVLLLTRSIRSTIQIWYWFVILQMKHKRLILKTLQNRRLLRNPTIFSSFMLVSSQPLSHHFLSISSPAYFSWIFLSHSIHPPNFFSSTIPTLILCFFLSSFLASLENQSDRKLVPGYWFLFFLSLP